MPDSIIPSLFSTPPPSAPATAVSMRAFGDAKAVRQKIYDGVLKSFSELEPVSNKTHSLRLRDVRYIDPGDFSRMQHKEALLHGKSLSRRLQGTWELLDAAGQVVDARKQVVAHVPHYTDLGTIVHNGVDRVLVNQQRLLPGAYTRQKDNGEIETHANIMPGKGPSHRYSMDPAKGVFYLHLGQSQMPVMPLLKSMGATDKELTELWGNDVYAANATRNDPAVLRKLKEKLLRKEDADSEESEKKLVEAFLRMEMDPEVNKRTLGKPHKHLDKEVLKDITRKLVAISKGEAETDDRDHLAYQQLVGPEDLLAERVRRDHSGTRRQLLYKASLKNSLAGMPSGALSSQLEQALIGSGLGQTPEETNPLEILDKQSLVTRLGEGGIPSLESIPAESRNVSASHMGFIDPARTPESEKVGIDTYLASNARKGDDGKLYMPVRNLRTGQTEWKSSRDLAESTIAFPSELRSQDKRIRAMKNGNINYVPRGEVAYELPNMEPAFSHLSNLIPMKSSDKIHRTAMGSRMLTQALPLVNPEAPLVQVGMPDNPGRSYEEEYSHHLGAVRAAKDGKILAVSPDGIKVQYQDGTKEDLPLYSSHPFARKTYYHQTPTLSAGTPFKQGELLAHSNYTDKNGAIALGANMRTGYMPWGGLDYEDAAVISASAAKRLSSEHLYRYDVEADSRTRLGKKNFIPLFAHKYSKSILDTIDENGVAKPGTVLEYGHPIMLAVRERDSAMNKVHRQKQAGFVDQSVVWDHHDPGVVTDVVDTPNGPVALVKSMMETRVGDKIAGRHGNKSIISAVIPDEQMPRGEDGQPLELLVQDDGVISRTNPAQIHEAALGKIAAKTGKPYKVQDFKDISDLRQYAEDELRRNNMTLMETLYDPTTRTNISSPVTVGNTFMMKLHHQGEAKGQGRSSGSYSQEDSPSKGGAGGCFVGNTLVKTKYGDLYIHDIVMNGIACPVATRDENGNVGEEPVTDWFHYRVPASELVTLELEDGVLNATKQHKMILADGSIKLAGDLQPGDELMEVASADMASDSDHSP